MNETTAKLVAEALAKMINASVSDGDGISVQDGNSVEVDYVEEADENVKVGFGGERATFRIRTGNGATFEIRVDQA